jgi:hypothetical protein
VVTLYTYSEHESAGSPAILTDIRHGFLQFLKADLEMVLLLGDDCFLAIYF